MKIDVRKWTGALKQGVVGVFRRYPVETLLLLGATAAAIVAFESDAWERAIVPRVVVVFWYALAVFIVNLGAGDGPWRRVYYAAWAPLVPLLCWPGLRPWLENPQTVVMMGGLTPLALLLVRRATDNRQFVQQAVLYLRAALLALFFANVAWGLFASILWSAAYIFGFEEAEWVLHFTIDTLMLTEGFAAPVLALMLVERWKRSECRGTRLLEVLVNYVLTPALVAYAALFYLYMAKIVVTWTLPRGYVAWMVFAFTLSMFLAGMIRRLLDKRICDWFYRNYSWMTLPAMTLFWIGTARRLSEYGVTEMRVYLLACGFVMTLSVALFFWRRTGRYLWLAAAAFVVCALMNYVPSLSAARLAIASQTARFESAARPLGLIDSAGRLRTTPVPLADTVRWREYRKAFGALEYLMNEDEGFHERVGLERYGHWNYRRNILPEELYDRIEGTGRFAVDTAADTVVVEPADDWVDLYLPSNVAVATDADYPQLYANLISWESDAGVTTDENGTVTVRVGGEVLTTIAGDELVRRQLERNAWSFDRLSGLDEAARGRLLDYRDERVRILFSNLEIGRSDSTTYRLLGATAELFWTR